MGTGRFPEEERRWSRRRLALHVRRSEAVLRQARSAGRDLRDELRSRAQPAERAGWHFPAAPQATLLRARHPAGIGAAEHPVRPLAALDSDSAPQRPRPVPLLRPVRARVLHALELLVDFRTAAAGDGYRSDDADHRRDGARGDDRRHRESDRRHLHQDGRRNRTPRARPHRCGGGEHVRDDADPAQLEIGAAPERAVEFERHAWQVPDRLHGSLRARFHPEARGHAPAQRGRHRRHAPLHAVVGRQPQAGFSARISHRDLGRPRHARATGSAAVSSSSRAAAATARR